MLGTSDITINHLLPLYHYNFAHQNHWQNRDVKLMSHYVDTYLHKLLNNFKLRRCFDIFDFKYGQSKILILISIFIFGLGDGEGVQECNPLASKYLKDKYRMKKSKDF